MLLAGTLLTVVGVYFVRNWYGIALLTIGFLLIAFTLWFFRDPERKIPPEALQNDCLVLAPADGKVIEIVQEIEKVYLAGKAIRISIFLSPLDVHVNRSPINGKVRYFKYHPGDYLVAWHPKASEKNEQTHIGVENSCGRVFFKQLTGFLARRIVYDIKEGDSVRTGERFGMMKFGSRMDVFVPAGTELFVKKNDRVRAGETVMARLSKF